MASELKAGTIFNFISIVVRLVVGFTMTPYMIYCLGENNFGLFSIAGGILAYLSLMDFGLGPTVTKYVAESVAKQDTATETRLIGQSIYLFSLLGILFALVGAVVYLYLGDLYSSKLTAGEFSDLQWMYILMVANTALFFPMRAFSGVLMAHQKFKLPGTVGLIHSLLNVALTFLLLWLGYGPVALVLAGVLLSTVNSLWNCWYCLRQVGAPIIFEKPDFSIFKSMMRYSLGIFINQLYDLVNWQLGPIILGATAGPSAVTVYRVGMQIPNIYMSLPWAISGVLFAKMVGMATLGVSPRDLTLQMVRVARIQSFIVFISLLGFLLYGKEFMHLWVGESLGNEAWPISIILMVALLIPLLQSLGITVVQAYNLNYYKAGLLCLTTPVTIVLACWLSLLYGASGFAWATAISGIGLSALLVNVFLYKRRLHLHLLLFFRETLRGCYLPLICTVLSAFAIEYLSRGFPPGWFLFSLKCVLLLVVYTISMLFLWASPDERNMILSFLKKRG